MKHEIGGTSTHKWRAVLGWSLGWAIAWSTTRWLNIGLSSGILFFLSGALGGGVAGFIGACGMLHFAKALEGKGKLIIAWVMSMASSEAIAWELGQLFAGNLSWILAMALGGGLAGGLGAKVTAFLGIELMGLDIKHGFLWVLGFAIGGAAGSIIVYFVAPIFSGFLMYQGPPFADAIIAQFLGGIVCGFVGGLIAVRRD